MSGLTNKTRVSNAFWITIIGIIVSLILAVLPTFITQNQSIALLIGLVGIGTTFLITVSLSIKASETKILEIIKQEEKEIIDVVALGEELARDEELRTIIKNIVDECEKVKKKSNGIKFVFVPKIALILNECLKSVEKLSDGEEDVFDEFSFRRSGITYAENTIQLVQYDDPSYFHSTYGRNYLKLQIEAIKRRVRISRVWLQNRDFFADPKQRKMLIEHEKLDIETYIAEKEMVPPGLHADYGVLDGKVLVTPLVGTNGELGEHLSINMKKVNEAADDFKKLLAYAEIASDYYKHLDEQNLDGVMAQGSD